jgi:hypothetical protein
MPHELKGQKEHDRMSTTDYCKEAKRRAQLTNIGVWSRYSRRYAFTSKEQYWTLMDDKSFELQTIEAARLIKSRRQFHGINNSQEKYDACLKKFPGINGHFGELTVALRRADVCPHGGIFYLDTMSQLDEKSAVASTMLAATLSACGPRTLVAANFCLTKPRMGHKTISANTFEKRLLAATSEAMQERWALVTTSEGHDCYLPGKTRATQMVTLFFWRKK